MTKPAGAAATRAEPIDVRPLTEATWPALAAVFAAGGDPKWCWCQYFRVRGLDWSNSSAQENRDRLHALATVGRPPGLVAFRGERAVGWVSLGPRTDFDRLNHAKLLAPVDERPTWSIVCFVVARDARGSGVATALLAGAVAYARDAGAERLEAYPVDTGGGKVPAANAYHGTLSMFEAAGFEVVERRQWNRTTPVRPIVRLELA
jgi:ribosomal protein S18 acetylase RimI-like enzyme